MRKYINFEKVKVFFRSLSKTPNRIFYPEKIQTFHCSHLKKKFSILSLISFRNKSREFFFYDVA